MSDSILTVPLVANLFDAYKGKGHIVAPVGLGSHLPNQMPVTGNKVGSGEVHLFLHKDLQTHMVARFLICFVSSHSGSQHVLHLHHNLPLWGSGYLRSCCPIFPHGSRLVSIR